MTTIQKAVQPSQLEQCLALRCAVFCDERGVPPAIERDGLDTLHAPCDHFLILSHGVPVGALRCCPADGGTVTLQRFCILKHCRRTGLGQQAVQCVEQYCLSRGYTRIVLDAKFEVCGFYEKCGYTKISAPFQEAGIPHIKMEKEIAPAAARP